MPRTLDDRVANGDSDVISDAKFGFLGRYCIYTASVASQRTIMHLILSPSSLDRHFKPPGANALGTCAFLDSKKPFAGPAPVAMTRLAPKFDLCFPCTLHWSRAVPSEHRPEGRPLSVF